MEEEFKTGDTVVDEDGRWFFIKARAFATNDMPYFIVLKNKTEQRYYFNVDHLEKFKTTRMVLVEKNKILSLKEGILCLMM
jgi:hypothetical protein